MNEQSSFNLTSNLNTGPTTLTDRIDSLDFLRGFAVLGILVMNIQSFAMPDPAYFNPTVYGDLTGVNFLVWLGSHLFFDSKFMTIFSMLFGAGLFLFCSGKESRKLAPAGYHYRRTLWLLLFGCVHAYLLWNGDILVWYSLSAFIVYLFRHVRPIWLITWGIGFLAVGTALYLMFHFTMQYWPPESIKGGLMFWRPGDEVVLERLEIYRSGWVEQMSDRVPSSLVMHTFIYLIFGIWRIVGAMLIGMAMMKTGVLSAERSNRFYYIMLLVGAVVGLSMIGYGASKNITHNWSFEYSMYGGSLFNYWGSIALALAYISALMLIVKKDLFARCRRRLGNVGRMAFTNYILMTIICTTLFYGHGFGLIGSVPRWGQLVITIVIWVVIVVLSNYWLKRYRFGPLEWLWRSLTYKKRHEMKLTT